MSDEKFKQFADAWKRWKESDEGKKCLDGTATGVYLENRLWYAFFAGVDVLDREPARVEKES